MTGPATLSHLHVQQNVPGGNGDAVVYTVFVNGAPTSLSVSLASTASTGADTTHAVPVVEGDRVAVAVTKALDVAVGPELVNATLRAA